MDETNNTGTALDAAIAQGKAIVDAAQLAAQNVAEVSQLAGDPQALATSLVWANKRIAELENAIALLQSPAAKAAEDAVEEAGEDVVKALPASWVAKVSALVTHAEAALGFRHNPAATK
jgi:hypothetical protein